MSDSVTTVICCTVSKFILLSTLKNIETAYVLDRSKYPYHRKLQNFVLWWFYVRFGLVDNTLKVGHNWSMGRCPISKMIFADLHVILVNVNSRSRSL